MAIGGSLKSDLPVIEMWLLPEPGRLDFKSSPDCHRGDLTNAAAPCRSDLRHPPIAIGGLRPGQFVV